MKKILKFLLTNLLIVILLFSVSGCKLNFFVSDNKTHDGSDTEIQDDIDKNNDNAEDKKDENDSEETTDFVYQGVSYDTLEKTAWEHIGQKPGLPSAGDVDILVIPIAFINTDYDRYGTQDEIKIKLETAFNGANEDTGWYSLQGYYRAVSYGKLNLKAKILDIFQTDEKFDLYSGESGEEDYEYLLRALEFYDEEIDYSVYDKNEDGKIDCVYLIYLAPYQKYDGETDLWWAYYYSYFGETKSLDDKIVFDYLWLSIEFFDDPIYEYYDEKDELHEVYVEINCETLIHETGHALGIDDYYDYEEGGVVGGIGFFVMMDANQGDYDPYSKAILGWTNPIVVSENDYTAQIRSFAETGDMIIISKSNGGTYFEEYYIIALYTPTGVNELKKEYNCGLPNNSGIMVWHVNATLKALEDFEEDDFYMVTDITRYNNGGADYKLLNLTSADETNEIDTSNDYFVSDKDLFKASGVINDLKWYDGTDLCVTIKIGEFILHGEIEQTQVTIEYQPK